MTVSLVGNLRRDGRAETRLPLPGPRQVDSYNGEAALSLKSDFGRRGVLMANDRITDRPCKRLKRATNP